MFFYFIRLGSEILLASLASEKIDKNDVVHRKKREIWTIMTDKRSHKVPSSFAHR